MASSALKKRRCPRLECVLTTRTADRSSLICCSNACLLFISIPLLEMHARGMACSVCRRTACVVVHPRGPFFLAHLFRRMVVQQKRNSSHGMCALCIRHTSGLVQAARQVWERTQLP